MAGELVLIVEDNPLNTKLLRDVLSASGYRTLETTNAEDGIEVARRDAPALILMDIQLPGKDGRAALIELKQTVETARIPVIAVTASVMPMGRKEILAAGFDGYQAKPFSVKDMLGEIRRVLDEAGKPKP
jgi:CheY-like chemotaxis protein